MILRIITAALLIPAVVALVWWGPPELVAVAAAIVAILALVEFFKLGERVGLRAFRKWTIGCSAALFYAQYFTGLVRVRTVSIELSIVRNATAKPLSLEGVLLIFICGCVAIGLLTRRPLHEVLPGIAISSAALLFITLPFSYVIRMNEMESVGRQLVLFTLVLVWVGDMVAYFVGRSLGRIPMAPALSPKKTWEGAFGNFFGAIIVAVLFAHWMEMDTLTMIVIAGLANIAGQAGDLIESAYKRGANVKDSGGLLPGHGGMLDRIDSLVFASPVAWAAYRLFLHYR